VAKSQQQIPMATWIDDWGRWFLRTYFIGSILTLVSFSLMTLAAEFPGPSILALLMAAVIVPLAFVGASLPGRLRAIRQGTYLPEPVDPVTGPGLLGQLSQMRWLVATLLMFGAWPGFYFVASKIGALQPPTQFHFEIDRRIPMVTALAPIYITIYWFFIFPALWGRGRAHFWPLLSAYGSLMVVCSTVFVIYPVEFPRDPLVVRHLGDWALQIVHGADPPINCFPSSHCAVATLSALALRDVHPPARFPGMAVALGICVATVLTKQHYLIDTLAGILLGGGAYYHFFKAPRYRRIIEVFQPRQS
jgi:membrane-associated phospholipid phosphatase